MTGSASNIVSVLHRWDPGLTNPVPDLLDFLSCFTIWDFDINSRMQRSVCVGAILVVDVDLQVQNLWKDLCGLRGGGVVKCIAAYSVTVIGIKGAGGDDLLKKLEVIRSSCM